MPNETASSISYARKKDGKIVGFSDELRFERRNGFVVQLGGHCTSVGIIKVKDGVLTPWVQRESRWSWCCGHDWRRRRWCGKDRRCHSCGRLSRRSRLSLVHVPWLRLCLRCTTSMLSLCYDDGSILTALRKRVLFLWPSRQEAGHRGS